MQIKYAYKFFVLVNGESYMNICEDMIINLIENLLKAGNDKFIIYPFGHYGKIVKSILNIYFGIQEIMILDNNLEKKFSGIFPVNILEEKEILDSLVIVTNTRADIREEIINELCKYISSDRYIELFEIEKMQKKEKTFLLKKNNERLNITNKAIQQELFKNNMYYYPKYTNSKFWLPYACRDLLQSNILMTDNYFEIDELKKEFFEFKNGKLGKELQGKTVIDIGANIGNHTLFYANELKAGKIICFEPQKEHFQLLKKNIELNNLEKIVECHCVGLSDKKGTATVKEYFDYNTGQNILEETVGGEIQLLTLDEFHFTEIYLIKIDVEGMEYSVLKGAFETIQNNKPYIIVESFENNFVRIRDILENFGYKYERISSADYLFYL